MVDDCFNFSPNDDDFEEVAKDFSQKRQVIKLLVLENLQRVG